MISAQMQNQISLLLTCVLLDIVVGPSDVGGTCPANSYLFVEGGKEFCCCGKMCCWKRCTWSQPPINCLPAGAKWIYNEELGYYQVKKSKNEK